MKRRKYMKKGNFYEIGMFLKSCSTGIEVVLEIKMVKYKIMNYKRKNNEHNSDEH